MSNIKHNKMKTILICITLIISSWTFSQSDNFYSSENIDSLINVLDQNKKNDMNKAYCLDQIVRYYINKEDYKSAGEYLLQYEELASQIGNPHALERSKYERTLWTYYASGREYLDTTTLTHSYEYFKSQKLDKSCLGIASVLCWYFDGFNGDGYGYDPNFKRHSSSTSKWYDIFANHAIEFKQYDDAAAAYCNYSIKLRKNRKYQEAKKYLFKAEEADLKSETNKWTHNIKSTFINLYFESEDPSIIEYYEQKINKRNDEELLLKFYDDVREMEFYYNIEDEMHMSEPGPWALKHDQLWAKLNPEQAKVKEEERLQREADRKERYSEQVSKGDNLLEEGKYEEAINAYCEARESTKERDEILEKLALARSAAIKGLTEETHEKESSSILKKRNEILDLLSISSDIPFSNNIQQISEVERQLDYSTLLKDILQKTNSFEREYEYQISEKSLKKAMSRLDELPPVEYYNISLVLLLEGYYGEAALLRGVGEARAQYSMYVSSGENQDEMTYRWMMMASSQNNRIFESHMVTADEAIKIQEQVISYLEKNDYTFAPKKTNVDAYELIVSEQKTSLLRIKSMREQLNQSYEHKKTQIMSSLKYLERENSELIPDTRTALNLEGTWYRTENIEYWIDTNVRSSMYENDEEYWEGEDYAPSDNDYGLTVGDRVQLISENFKESFPSENYEEEEEEEGYSEEEYISEEFTGEEYVEEEFTEGYEEEHSNQTREGINVQIIERKKSRSVVISNHPIDQYNGDYITQDGLINNLPWYKNEHDQYLYFYDQAEGGSKSWSLDHRKPDGSKDWYSGGYIDPVDGLQHPQEGKHHWNSVPEEYETEENEEEYFEGYKEEFNGDNKFAWTKEKDKYKGQEGTVIEIDNYNESLKLLFDDATIFFVTYSAIGMDTEIDSESEDANWESVDGETEELNEEMYDEYIEPTILQYIDTIFYSFNTNLSANLNKLPSTPNEPSFDEMEFQNINYNGWKSLDDLREAIEDTKRNMNYTYSLSNDGKVNYLSLQTNSDMNNDYNSFEQDEDYGDGEFYDHSCVDHWMPSINNGFYSKKDRYTIYLENNSTLVIGKTYINNPNKFIPGSIIKLKRF